VDLIKLERDFVNTFKCIFYQNRTGTCDFIKFIILSIQIHSKFVHNLGRPKSSDIS